ncbi:MAG: hypothetical protein PHF33_05175 [Candidatus Delongbacteria bacterium]|nr:hypothetical protein [Candidatus Delongbacteria bacterium]
MRKSINEKVEIAKKAKSAKLIKKLSVQHGITTKTIKIWIELYNAGELTEHVKTKNIVSSKRIKDKAELFKEAVFKTSAIYSVLEGKTIYRYLFKDINNGILLCAYSDDNSIKHSKKILTSMVKLLTDSGVNVKRVLTDVKFAIIFKNEIKNYEILTRKSSDIKKYLSFSIKSNSFMKERTRYEMTNDFLFDSCATVAKNNDNLFQKLYRNKVGINDTIKKINIILHSVIIKDKERDFNELSSRNIINEKLTYALDFHKKFDLDTAFNYYSQIEQIVCPGYDRELYIKVIVQKAKVYAIRRDISNSDRCCKISLREASLLTQEKKISQKYSIYMLLSDLYRFVNDYKKSLYYIERAKTTVERGNSAYLQASFYINYSIFLKTRKNYEIKMEYIKKAREIAEKNNLKDLIDAAEDIIADYHFKRGEYQIALDKYSKMIKDDIYKDMNVQKAVLFSKYADCLQYSGYLSKSLQMYDRVLDFIAKFDDNPSFRQYKIIAKGNKSVLLSKMNDFNHSIVNFKENIDYAKKNDLKRLVIDNQLNLCYALLLSHKNNEAAVVLKEINLLLEHSENPSHKYAESLYEGMLLKAKGKFLKAEIKILESRNIVQKIPTLQSAFFKILSETAELYIKSGDHMKANTIIRYLRTKALKKGNVFFIFRSELLSTKFRFFKKNKQNNYNAYIQNKLNDLNYSTEEQKYFLQKELEIF